MSEANGNSERSAEKGTCWSITINNPTDDDNTTWSGIHGYHWVIEAKGQIERGEEGTLHLQGMLRTKSVRFAQVKKALPRAHIEKARAPAALAKYVVKEDTRVSAVPTVKVATLADLQRRMLRVTLKYCETIDQKFSVPTYLQGLELLKQYEFNIQHNWERLLDECVKSLIEQGFYGIEFVVANPQIRTAFKKYLPSILYRQYGSQVQADEEARASSQAHNQAQGVFEGSGDCPDTDD